MVSAHKCPKYDETKFNRVSPNCPLCNVVVSVLPGQDANVAMEAHFAKDCPPMTGKAKARSTPVCAKARCGQSLFAPIRCTKCNQQFCPAHRFPADHTCSSAGASGQRRTTGPTAGSRLLDLNAKASAAGAATVGAIKTMTSGGQASSSKPTAVSAAATAVTKSGSRAPNLFSKTDRSPYSSSIPDVNINTTCEHNELDETKLTPEPVVWSPSFVPRPIFASA